MHWWQYLLPKIPQVFSHWNLARIRPVLESHGMALVWEQGRMQGLITKNSVGNREQGFAKDLVDSGIENVQLSQIATFIKKKLIIETPVLLYSGELFLGVLQIPAAELAREEHWRNAEPQPHLLDQEVKQIYKLLNIEKEHSFVLQALLDLVPLPMLEVNERWRVVGANQIWRDLAGVFPEELIGLDGHRLLYVSNPKELLLTPSRKKMFWRKMEALLMLHEKAYPVMLRILRVHAGNEIIFLERQ